MGICIEHIVPAPINSTQNTYRQQNMRFYFLTKKKQQSDNTLKKIPGKSPKENRLHKDEKEMKEENKIVKKTLKSTRNELRIYVNCVESNTKKNHVPID